MDPYSELGISPGATEEEIKSAYRQLAKQYHPDANPQDEQSAEKMNRINKAYNMLREGITFDLELDEDWYREQAEDDSREQTYGSRRKAGIFYNPVFRSVVVIAIVICMVVMGILSSFYSAFWAGPVEETPIENFHPAEDYPQKYLDKKLHMRYFRIAPQRMISPSRCLRASHLRHRLQKSRAFRVNSSHCRRWRRRRIYCSNRRDDYVSGIRSGTARK